MNAITDAQVTAYVEANIGAFHSKRLEALKKLRLEKLLRRKNPYLFKSRNLTVASDLIRSLLTAHLSSQEETLFGEFLEGLAIYVAEIVHGGQKSAATGIDLEFTAEDVRYIVSIQVRSQLGQQFTDLENARQLCYCHSTYSPRKSYR